jgi:hypothetical protein
MQRDLLLLLLLVVDELLLEVEFRPFATFLPEYHLENRLQLLILLPPLLLKQLLLSHNILDLTQNMRIKNDLKLIQMIQL